MFKAGSSQYKALHRSLFRQLTDDGVRRNLLLAARG